MQFLLNLVGNKERDDFIFLSNKKDKVELCLWDNKRTILSVNFKAARIALHPSKTLIAYTKDCEGDENYNIYTFDYGSNQITKINSHPLGDIIQLFWLENDDLLIIGFNQYHYFINIIKKNGVQSEIFTSEKQILNVNYDTNTKYLAAAIGRKNTKIALFDLKQSQSPKWIETEGAGINFPAINSDGQIAYVADYSKHSELVVRNIKSLEQIVRVKVPGFIGSWIFDTDAIQWIDSKKMIIKIGFEAKVTPYIFQVTRKQWIGPLTDFSIEKIIVTKKDIVWTGSKLNKGFVLERYRNDSVEQIIKSDTIFNLEYESHWFPSFDDRLIHAWLIKNAQPDAPLLVYLHGGPTYTVKDSIEPFSLALALGGFNLFVINFRGSVTFGAEYRDLNIGDMGGGDLKDVIYGTKYVKHLLGIRDAVGIFGESYGAFLTLMAVAKYPNEFISSVAWGASIDHIKGYNLANSHYKSFYSNFLGGTPKEKPELYRERSPITYLRNLKVPSLIIHSENDSRIPMEPILDLMKIARSKNLPIEFSIAKEGHSADNADVVVKNIIDSILYFNKLRKNVK